MKCPKCGSEVKPKYKFCSKCGQPMPAEESNPVFKQVAVEKGKSSDQKEDNVPALVENVTNDIDLVRGKAVWSIGPGQLARRVSESEFAQLDKVKGVVIQEGVTAVISVDGQMMGMLSGGYYEFASQSVKEKAEKQADKEEAEDKENEGIVQKLGNTARRVWRFLTGTKDKEKSEARKKRKERVKKNIEKIKANSTVNVTLISTRIFDLLFGSSLDSQGNVDFVPMTVKTKVVDLEVGVSLQMQITNVNDFLLNYLADKKSFAVADAQKMIQPTIENLLGRILRNLDYQVDGLPVELVDVIKNQIIKTVNERIHGLEVVKVLDITDHSADFERFRSVEHELFASEHELGYLQRTGEFRNRLAEETNRQTVDEAKNEENLRYALSNVNRDGLLHDDEMEAFVQLLNSQKRLREAKTDEQEYEALQDLRKCRLVKDEDVAVLEDMLQRKELERSEVTELLRLRVFRSTEEARLKAENALSDLALQQQFNQELSSARHNVAMTDLEIEAQRKRDEYLREQTSKDLDLEHRQAEFEREQRRAEKMDDVDVLERKAAIARENMAKMQEHERRMHEMEVELQKNRDNNFTNMTAEQIRAAQLSHLDASAQVEMARSYSSDKENDLLKQMMERDERSHDKESERMLEMARMMQQGISSMGSQRISDIEKMKEEYRDQAIHQQERTDRTQDSALNYTTRVTESSQESNPTVTVNSTSAQPVFCPYCGGKATTADKNCPHCGELLED